MSFYSDFAGHYEAVFPFREAVLAFLSARLPPGPRRVLDLGCGPGHYCGRLAGAGHDVVGIDLDPLMIAAASRAYPAARFEILDLLEFDRLSDRLARGPAGAAQPNADSPFELFDLVYCIGNVLAHVAQDRLSELLAKLRAVLRPGGAWLLQTVNWDHVLDREGETYRFPARTLPGGVTFSREYRDVSNAAERVRFLTRLFSPSGELFAGEVNLYPLRAGEYRRLHAAAGFIEESHWADFTGAPFRSDAEGGSVWTFRSP